MSEARNQRFEIDIEEIERQLRRPADVAPASRPDPLAELARIVGHDDPFGGVLGDGRGKQQPSNVHVLNRPGTQAAPFEPVLDEHDRAVLHGREQAAPATGQDDIFDLASDGYGQQDGYADQDLQPLRPRRSRGRLAAVMAGLVVTVAAVGGGLYWKKGGASFSTGGAPPVITADRTPLKVAPENPGGVEVPNQDRQIYQRGATDGQSRVVDGREQPLDVREAARSLPPAPTVSARAPVASSGDPAAAPRTTEPRQPDQRPVVVAAPASNAVATALGEPRRVRTVAVRPDGTTYAAATTASVTDAMPSLLPGSNSLPPPVPVATVSVPARSSAGSAPSSAAPVAAAEPPVVVDTSSGPPVTSSILPPRRPKIERKTQSAAEAPTRTASLETSATERPAAERPAAARANFSVQVAVRPSEEEARAAYSALQGKFGSALDGKSARVTQAEVGGKTVHRVRIGPMSKDEATKLCSNLKSSGGSCFVAGN